MYLHGTEMRDDPKSEVRDFPCPRSLKLAVLNLTHEKLQIHTLELTQPINAFEVFNDCCFVTNPSIKSTFLVDAPWRQNISELSPKLFGFKPEARFFLK